MKRIILSTLAVFAVGLTTAPSASAYFRYCSTTSGLTVRANERASCPFARNVARSFATGVYNETVDPINDETSYGRVYSPTTRRWYRVKCNHLYSADETVEQWSCSAGNRAYVRLTYYV